MLDYQKYLMRFGEYGVQSLIEQIERVERVRSLEGQSLEERWNTLMQSSIPLAA